MDHTFLGRACQSDDCAASGGDSTDERRKEVEVFDQEPERLVPGR